MTTEERLRLKLGDEWYEYLHPEFETKEMKDLNTFIQSQKKAGRIVYPDTEDIFNAFKMTQPSKAKVVIIGQDPYPHRHAHGLAFSTLDIKEAPPSLKNIFQEVEEDLQGLDLAPDNNLARWARQGVMLLNAILTVNAGYPLSHQNKGWEYFTTKVIQHLYVSNRPITWMLWGKYAQEYYARAVQSLASSMAFNPVQQVITSPHPSPKSAHMGFHGSRPFSKANDWLTRHGEGPINWI